MTGVRAFFLFLLAALTSASLSASPALAADPLPSWNKGPVKQAIIGYVTSVSTSGSPQFLHPRDRIAVFDLDGTLWPEQPVAEVDFMLARIRDMAVRNSDLPKTPPYDKLYSNGAETLAGLPAADVMKIFLDTHSGMTEDDFSAQVREFFYDTKHPRFAVSYGRTVYQPMIELLAYLRANGFKTFLCTNGDVSFARVISEDLFGIPPEQVIGTLLANGIEENGGRLRVVRQPELDAHSDREGKISAIIRHIGKRPVFVAGNIGAGPEGGDAHMARYSMEGVKPSLQLMINHDDGARESAYGSKDQLTLGWAKNYGWQIVSMKSDWKQIFGAGAP